ncbi:MAG: hypothetical protein ACM359_05575, partial [Bacillota bacterium]
VIKLWESPMTGPGDGTGYIAISAPTLAGETATYGLTLTLPVNFDQVVVDEYGATVRATGQGTFTATGQFTHTFAPLPPEWQTDGGGSWGDATHWSAASIPNGPGAKAYFTSALTAPNAPAVITLDGDKTVGEIYFRNQNSHYIEPGSGGSLILNNAGQDARIQVDAGSHTISAPVHLADNASIDIAVDSRLDIGGRITAASGKNLTKKGPGLLHCTIELDPTSTLSVDQGNLSATRIIAGTLRIAAGALTTLEPTPSPATSVIHALDIAGSPDAWEGTLDITRSRLIIQADAQTAQQVLAQVSNQVKTGRSDGWKGHGISSSAAQANEQTGLAVVLNNDGTDQPIFKTFGDIPADLNSIFVIYTWDGDVTLDGKVDGDDYFLVDSGFISQLHGYQNGDLNFDGTVDGDDYFLMDSAFLVQTGPLDATHPAIPVPEPAALSLLLLGSLPALLRRHYRISVS